MKKKDIRKEISTRKYKQTWTPFCWFYRTVLKVMYRKYDITYNIIDDINKCEGPAFVIFNHLSRVDHMYINEITYPRKVNMLAGYNEFFRSHLHFPFKYNNVLPKKNYATDIVSTKAIMQIIKQGGCVSFAPEGLATNDGMNKPIVPGTGHMLKHFGIPVYFVRLQGQHLQQTKVVLSERPGKTSATIKILFTKEDLKNLSSEEIDNRINEEFRNDEYEWAKQNHTYYKNKGDMAVNLEQILYKCPKCGSEFTLKGFGNTFMCNNCHNGTRIDGYYDFYPLDYSTVPSTVSEWVRNQRMGIIKEIRKDENYCFSEHVSIGRLPNDHYVKHHKTSEIVGEGMLSIDHSGLHYKDEKDETLNFDLDYKSLYTLITTVDASYFNLYVNGEYTDIFLERNSFMKWNLLVEEMHRLHVNFYKNFPWNDYMYK